MHYRVNFWTYTRVDTPSKTWNLKPARLLLLSTLHTAFNFSSWQDLEGLLRCDVGSSALDFEDWGHRQMFCRERFPPLKVLTPSVCGTYGVMSMRGIRA